MLPLSEMSPARGEALAASHERTSAHRCTAVSSPSPLPSLEAILDSVPYSAVALVDREGSYRRIGGVLWEQMGLDPRRALLGKRIRELWEPLTADALHGLLDTALEGERQEGTVAYGDRSYHVVISPIAATLEGDDPMALLFARDVTEQEESEQLFQDVIASVPVGVAATDEEGTITVWNEAAAAIVGLPIEGALGSPVAVMYDHIGIPESSPLIRAARGSRPWRGDVPFMRAGIERTLHIVRRPSGEGRRAVAIMEDVTEARRTAAIEERERRLRSLGRVAGGVAHDFGNLLTAISSRIDLMIEDTPGGRARTGLQEVREALDVAEELTARLLTVGDARTEQGRCVPSEVALRMQGLLARLTDSNIEVRLELVSRAPVELGSAAVEQVLLNLVTNAADAMPTGGVVRVEIVDDDAHVILRVCDEGRGIHPETLPHIFDPFVSTKPVGQGTGMGLSTVHGLATAGGGSVRVEQTGSEGTCIALRLPRLKESAEGASHDPPAAEELYRGDKRVLVIEDEVHVRTVVVRVLERLGCEIVAVDGVEAGRQALEREGPFDLLLSDVSLPGEDGITFANEVRTILPDMPVILMSGNFAQQINRHGPVPPGVVTLDKPFGVQRLRATLATTFLAS